VADPAEQPERTLDSNCPTCGAPAERGQLVCLECGSRIALAYKRPPSWKLPIAIVVIVGVLAMAGAVLAYEAIDDEAKEEVANTPLKPKQASGVRPQASGAKDKPPAKAKPKAKAEPKAKAKPKAEAKPKPAASSEGLVAKGDLYTWPRDLGGFTVVLLSAEDRASATTFAQSVAEAKEAKTGVIRADDFQTLPKGFYVVFAGSYKTRARADRATARLGAKYQGAFTQLVKR
jgi:septal ring-binding cell division protein DamX